MLRADPEVVVAEQRKDIPLRPAVAALQRDLRLLSEDSEEWEDTSMAPFKVCCHRMCLRLKIAPVHHRTRPCVAVERRVQMAL
jgi:hypothetical protein